MSATPLEIQDSAPLETGLYVAYVNDSVTTWAGKKLLMRQDNRWWHPGSDQVYRDHVYGWIGPLPALALA